MRIAINLATRPFVELRPLFARLRLAMAVLAVVAIGLAIGLHFLSQREAAAQAQIDALKAQTLAFETERQADVRKMQEPQNQAVLARSTFLNTLFTEKSFSWTSVMMDLEGVLPTGVQVTSIEPSLTPEGDVSIRLRVSGDRDAAVELVRKLEHSQRFLRPQLVNETAQTQQGGGTTPVAFGPVAVEFNIMSGYNPLPETVKDSARTDAADSSAAASSKVPSTKKSGGAR